MSVYILDLHLLFSYFAIVFVTCYGIDNAQYGL